jgi:hypothetical protein
VVDYHSMLVGPDRNRYQSSLTTDGFIQPRPGMT